VRIFCSHPIRGASGDVEGNSKKALGYAKRLRKDFPEVEWYIPAEQDRFPQTAMFYEFMTIEQVLEVDLEILYQCDGLLSFYWEKSEGVEKEFEFAIECDMPRTQLFRYDVRAIGRFIDRLRRLTDE
jgi:hypothetical protein